MTKSEWIAIAEALAAVRTSIDSSLPAEGAHLASYLDWHDRKLIYFAQLEAVDKIAVMMAATMDGLVTNFDRHRFLRLVGGKR